MIKNKYILSALFNALSSFFYFLLIVKLSKTNDMLSIIVVSFSVFLGTLLPQYLMEKFQKDAVWVYEITPTSPTKARELADTLRENNVPVTTVVAYTKEKEKTLHLRAYSQSKEYSKLIEDLIPETCMFSVSEVKNFNF
jgi:hypothetical protein